MTDRPIIFSAPMVRALLDGRKTQTRRLATSPLRRCEPGDRLYVREAFALVGGGDPGFPIYRADYPACVPEHFENVPTEAEVRWTPSIHMPRWASRLTLTVEAVRVEPLQVISEADAIAEGVELTETCCPPGPLYRDYLNDDGEFGRAVWSYESLWKALHGADSWAANPDVLVLTFRVERGNIDRSAA